MDAKELSRTTADAINSYSFSNSDFCQAMALEHRTLQQCFTRLCFEWIKHCSEMEHYDGRNEASVKACQKVQQLVETEGLVLPFI